MRDLYGRIDALDPGASESLRIIGYFDALTSRGVGLGGLLRAAAVMSGTTAGAHVQGRTVAYGVDGRRADVSSPRDHRVSLQFHGGAVWLHRPDGPGSHDEMILDRLAVAVEALEHRNTSGNPLEALIDPERSPVDRAKAATRLGVGDNDMIRIIVSEHASTSPSNRSLVTPTPYGIVHSTIDMGGWTRGEGRAGLGIWVRADKAPESWWAAMIAYRLSAHGPDEVVDAGALGAMLELARSHNPDHPHPDVTVLAALDDDTAKILRALVDSESLRSAAAKLAMHHSTLQARHESLTAALGYDPRTTVGRMRYIAAEFLRRLD